MAAMEAAAAAAGQDQQPPAKVVERLNPALQQQLNLDSVKTRAISLFKAISRILEELDAIARANATPKWQDVLGQFSMVNLELYNIVEDIKNVSKAFVVHPKNVNAENATILPVMLSSKLLPEMETEDNTKREQLLHGMHGLPVAAQIDKLKTRIDMIGAACESAEKIIADARKSYFSTRHGTNLLPTIDKVQAAKIQEQENLLRSAVNHGEVSVVFDAFARIAYPQVCCTLSSISYISLKLDFLFDILNAGLRVPGDQRQVASSLPMHLVDVLATNDSLQDSSGVQFLCPLCFRIILSLLLVFWVVSIGFDASADRVMFVHFRVVPEEYASTYSSFYGFTWEVIGWGLQEHNLLEDQQLPLLVLPEAIPLIIIQQRLLCNMPIHPDLKMLQQQLLSQQQLRPSSMPVLGQMHGQHHVQFSQPLGAQQLQSRQLTSAAMQHMSPNQMNQGNQLNRQLNQFSSPANSALFNAAQATPTSQMIPNMSAMMPSQSVMPRMQHRGLLFYNSLLISVYAPVLPVCNVRCQSNSTSPKSERPEYGSPSSIVSLFNMGAANTGGGMMQIQQQQQHGAQGAFGNMQQGGQNMQPGMMTMQNTQQNHPNFQQQRPQNQQ
ncbi:hypothetical protein SASPL_112263 [Salvia splendens]|uniref:Mediator of RNA polymerase II transcription subunit 8 n=1 Tax=Salvia splendens TaxID=180675 RepID=A0A8X8YDJ1_SALSN|nr:hypothetical protein SASPL_112263 [Salvia splendens]